MADISVTKALDKLSAAIKDYVDYNDAKNAISEDDISQASNEDVIKMLTEVLDNE